MKAEYSKALPLFVDRHRTFINQNSHRWIVLHKTAGFRSAQQVAEFFARDPNMASTHFVVGQDGTIAQCVLIGDGAAGNCCLEAGHAPFLPEGVNLNLLTISIEHVDPATDNSTLLTPEQKAASFALVKWLCEELTIPMRPGDADGGIIRHRDIAPINRARCPGNYPWDELFTYLKNGGKTMIDLSNPDVANYFEEASSGAWRCKQTGFLLIGGILKFYQSFGNDGLSGLTFLGLPKSNEIPVDGYPGVVEQQFERGRLRYDPRHALDNPPGAGSVYLMHSAVPTPPLDPAIKSDLASAANALADALKRLG